MSVWRNKLFWPFLEIDMAKIDWNVQSKWVNNNNKTKYYEALEIYYADLWLWENLWNMGDNGERLTPTTNSLSLSLPILFFLEY